MKFLQILIFSLLVCGIVSQSCDLCRKCIAAGGGNACIPRCPSSCKGQGDQCIDCVMVYQGGKACMNRCQGGSSTLKGYGVDYSVLFSVSDIQCLVGQGFTFAIPRGYCSYGAVDENVVQNIKNAWAGGMKSVDVYLFPCVKCGNPKGQVRSLVNALNGLNFGTIWVDIEIYSWGSDLNANRQFALDMVNEVKAAGKNVGIYTSEYNWEEVVGSSWSGLSSYPVWYAHYDKWPSFGDWRSFGGWNKGTVKQYEGDVYSCGLSLDKNFAG